MADKLNTDEIQTLINRHITTTEDRNWKYYLGANPTIVNQTDKAEAPDYKIPVPLARKMIHTITGYSAKPGLISFNPVDEQDDEQLRDIFKFNNEGLETTKIFTEAAIQGYSYEIHFVDDNMPQFAHVPVQQIIAQFNNEIKPELEYVIRHYDITDPLTRETTKFAEIYYSDVIQKYESTSGKYILVDEIKHRYGQVPIIQYKINEERQGIFQHVISLIDQHDRILSEDIANELAKFADAYLKLSKNIDQETYEKIKDLKVFDNLGTEGDFVDWLTKNVNDTFVKNSADRFERLIYETSQIPNFNEEKFNNKSGIAIAFALIDFENLASSIEAFFTVGLYKRVELLNKINQEMFRTVPVEINIKWERNLPFNLAELKDIVVALKQHKILSMETILKLFPSDIVPNAEEEKERIAQESEENMLMFENTFNRPEVAEDETPEEDNEE